MIIAKPPCPSRHLLIPFYPLSVTLKCNGSKCIASLPPYISAIFCRTKLHVCNVIQQKLIRQEGLGEGKDSVREISAKQRVMSLLLLSLLLNLQIMNRLNRKRQQALTYC